MLDVSAVNAFREGITPAKLPDYRDPMAPEYFGPLDDPGAPEGPPLWSTYAWTGKDGYVNPEREGASMKDRTVNPRVLARRRAKIYEQYGVEGYEPGAGITEEGCEVAAIGGKGSGKSFALAMGICHMMQEHPGIKIGIAANSYDQAFGSGAEKLTMVARAMGLDFEYYGERTIDDYKHRYVYYFPDFDAKICVLSFEKMKLIEGTSWDGFHFEELQDCKQEHVQTAISRARRGTCKPFFYYAGMPDDTQHWMYEFFEKRCIPLYEPPLKENMHNVEPGYLARLHQTYDGQDVERYIEGKRVALNKMRVFPSFKWPIHVESELSHRLCQYDPYRKLYFSVDFNVAPMCAIAVQVKEWDFPHGSETHRKTLVCVVDEFELWNATTHGLMQQILYEQGYCDHDAGGAILGDATGNRRDTRSPGQNDWGIIRQYVQEAGLINFRVIPGLIRRRRKGDKRKPGEPAVKYSNPPVRDTITALNAALIDGDGDPGWLFKESHLPSGGVAKAISQAEYDMQSRIDDSNDKREGRELPRTHFVDDVRYMNWFLNGSTTRPHDEQRRSMMGKIGKRETERFARYKKRQPRTTF